jgi:hypothetical protein
MKKTIVTIFLSLMSISWSSSSLAVRKVNDLTESGLTKTDFRKIKKEGAQEISRVLSSVKDSLKPVQKLADLQKGFESIVTKSEQVNKQVFADLGKVLGVLRGFTSLEEYRKSQAILKEDLKTLTQDVQESRASKTIKDIFIKLETDVNDAVEQAATVLSEQGSFGKQTNVPQKQEVQGYFSNVFGIKPERAQEAAGQMELHKKHRKCIEYKQHDGYKRCSKYERID